MTVASLISALILDQGLSPRESYNFFSICGSISMLTCFIDADNKPEGLFFPLRCSRIQYEGKTKRKWGDG